MAWTTCEVIVPKTIGRRGFDGTDVRAIASEARCKVYVEAQHLSPVANTRLLVVAGDPDQVGRALAAAMDHIQRLYAEARRLPCTATYRYVYGKASLYIPSHFANVLSSRRDLVDALLDDGGVVHIAPIEEMSIGVTKRQVQVMGTEPEVHAIVAKLDASLQRHEAWRQSQQLQGDEVVLKCVFKNSVLAQCDQVIKRLDSRFTVSVTTTAGTRDRSVLAISGCKHEVIQATMYVASKVASSRPAPSNARSHPRRSREREPPTARQCARPVPRSLQGEPALAPRVSAETDAPRAPRMVKHEAPVAAALGSIDLNEIGRVAIPSRDPRLLRRRAPLVRPSVPLHAMSLLSQEPSSMRLELAERPQAPPARAVLPMPARSVVVKPEPNSELRPPIGRSPEALQQHVTAPLPQPHASSPRHASASWHVRPEALARPLARSASLPVSVPSAVVKPEPESEPQPPVGQSLHAVQQPVVAPPLQPERLPLPRHESASLRARAEAAAVARPALPLLAASVVVKPEPTSEIQLPVGRSPLAVQLTVVAPPFQPQQLPSARPRTPVDAPARAASSPPAPSIVIKPDPSVGSSPAAVQQRVTAPRDVPLACAAAPTNQESPIADVFVKSEPPQALPPASHQHAVRPCDPPRAPVASSHPMVQAEPVQPATEVHVKSEPRLEYSRAEPSQHVIRPREPRLAHAAMPPTPSSRLMVQAAPVRDPATEVYIKPEPRPEPTNAASLRSTSSSAPTNGLTEAPRAEAKRKATVSESNGAKRPRPEMPVHPCAPSATLCAQATRVTSRIARSIALRLVQSGLQQVVAGSKATVRLEPDAMDANYYTLSITGAWADTLVAQRALQGLAPDP